MQIWTTNGRNVLTTRHEITLGWNAVPMNQSSKKDGVEMHLDGKPEL